MGLSMRELFEEVMSYTGKHLYDDVLSQWEGLTLDEAIELSVNRQLITCQKDDDDLFPYDYKYREGK